MRRRGNKTESPVPQPSETARINIGMPRNFIARFPVTVAQFRAFVEATGYTPKVADSLSGLANHPVVDVTWQEAVRYCVWLTERFREWQGTPEPIATLVRQEGWYVALPSEEEWERAALDDHDWLYPWGNDPDPDRANYAGTAIHRTSAVGSFPRGASPYGVEEMSGNVSEWTRTAIMIDADAGSESHVEPSDRQEDFQPSDLSGLETFIQLKGGAFINQAFHLECASPYAGLTVSSAQSSINGFRVVLRPPLPNVVAGRVILEANGQPLFVLAQPLQSTGV